MKLKASNREITGRKVKTIRESGGLPAVVYGRKRESTNITLDPKEFLKVFREVGYNKLFDLDIDGKTSKVLVKDIQKDPLTNKYIHIDLYEIDMTRKIVVDVPVELTGESSAVKNNVGFLVTPIEALTVHCLPTNIPDKFVINIDKLQEINDAIQIDEIELPEGVELDSSIDTEAVLARIVPPQKEIVEEEPEEEVAEGEEGEAVEGEEGEAAEGEVTEAEGGGEAKEESKE